MDYSKPKITMTAIEFQHCITQRQKDLELFTRRFTNNYDDSQDLIQETILKALTYRERFKPDTNLKGWLYTIMKNTFINNYRKVQRSKTSFDNTENLFYLNVEDPHTFNCPEKTARYQDLLDCIEKIRVEYRRPFKMHIDGYKYEEIAERLNIPIGTVKNRIFHARKEIQDRLTR